MDNTESERLSDSLSSSSEDEDFQRPSFSATPHHGFKQTNEDVDLLLDEEAYEPPSKKIKVDDFDPDEKAKRMMEKMGYKQGIGLGKHGQGRLEPVEASKQKGRRGLGHYNEKLKEANLRWNPEEEVVCVRETIEWLKNSQQPVRANELEQWMRIGLSKDTIEDEILFCDPDIVTQVVDSKCVFDHLDKNEMRRARTRSNPFETIRGAFFLNRAAVKMANMDRACNFMFTNPELIQKSDELLYFADVCAGPGGFSEYVLWKKNWHAKGFGFTLKETNDFKLEDFYAGSPETFHPYYGPRGDGDVYNPENQEAFRKLIMQQTKNKGVHFMMSDGGFSVEGQESIQEILSKQLYLCQCLVALMIVREHGNFVTKVFDLFTPFSAGLVYLMYRCFKHVSIFKPNTSRPANSERYLICRGRLANVDDTINYLQRANRVILKKDKNRDVMELVPHSVLEEDERFFQYLKDSNNSLGRKQIVGLLKIAAFTEDTTLLEHRQAEIRKECLEYWGLPDKTRTIPRNMKPEDRLKSIMKTSTLQCMTSVPQVLTTSNLESTLIPWPYDWFYVLCGTGSNNTDDKAATFYMGMGRTKTFRYTNGSWIRVSNLELPPDTLVYAEQIWEARGESRQQRKVTALHILDAYWLGSEDVSQHDLRVRHNLTKSFAEALWKPTSGEYIRVRAKDLHSLTNNLEENMRLEERIMKNGMRKCTHMPSRSETSYDYDGDLPYFFVPNSVLFFKQTAQHWTRNWSQTHGQVYYYNIKTGTNAFEERRPENTDAAFPETFENRIIWYWPPDPALTIENLWGLVRKRCEPSKNIKEQSGKEGGDRVRNRERERERSRE